MEMNRKSLAILVAVALCTFLPPITSVPFPQEDTPLVIREVISQTSAEYLWLSPVVHVATVVLLFLLYRYGQKMGRVVDAYFGILFLFFAFSQNIARTESYGLAVITGNLVMILTVGLFWMWEVFRPRNEYLFQRLPVWRYWVVPFAILAFWFPVNSDTSPNLSPLLLLTSSFGVLFCPTTPVVIAILTLIFPTVNRPLLRVTSFVGLLMGLFNAMSLFVMPGYTLWLLFLHTPLILISLYGLLISLQRTELSVTRKPGSTQESERARKVGRL